MKNNVTLNPIWHSVDTTYTIRAAGLQRWPKPTHPRVGTGWSLEEGAFGVLVCGWSLLTLDNFDDEELILQSKPLFQHIFSRWIYKIIVYSNQCLL